jgi:hypothetical protein
VTATLHISESQRPEVETGQSKRPERTCGQASGHRGVACSLIQHAGKTHVARQKGVVVWWES